MLATEAEMVKIVTISAARVEESSSGELAQYGTKYVLIHDSS